MHPQYLPFAEDVLREHFAPVASPGHPDAHLKYYQESLASFARLQAHVAAGLVPKFAEIRRGRQLEKDERFWVVAALMSLRHDADPKRRFAELLARADMAIPTGFASWADALVGPLHLFFEVGLPTPKGYGLWLRQHLNERVPIPYLREAAESANPLEGRTNADAVLLAPDTGVCVVFEAKVLSDVSTTVQFDVARNQLARIIDVTLDENPNLMSPLRERRPELTYTVLLTPRLFHPDGGTPGTQRSRLYGWLLPEYRKSGSSLLRQHLPHRDGQLDGVERRIGWVTWEDVNDVRPGACPWLDRSSQNLETVTSTP